MSFSGKFTSTQLNLLGELNQDRGFNINADAQVKQGTWTPTSYTQGTTTSSTVLGTLTTAIRRIYQHIRATSGTPISTTTYRKLLALGSSTVPALGNSKPDSFKPSYAGYGTWSDSTLQINGYPPKEYPAGTKSWINLNKGGYSWITGWPGKNSWQKATDTYRAAYLPSAGESLTDYDEYFSNGFVATIARQAYYQNWTGQPNRINAIVNSFSQADSYRQQQNDIIMSYVNNRTLHTSNYSNINDLTTANVSGVSQAFKLFGTDLINSGRAIDLSAITQFGLPSVLLRTLKKNGCLIDALALALFLKELTQSEINSIVDGTTASKTQEQKIYSAFLLISGNDLAQITEILNCKLTLSNLADLLDPKKLCPTSMNTLTVPQFNSDYRISISSKIYDFIYINGGVNNRIHNYGSEYLDGILPPDLILACGAFSATLQQIPNIAGADIQKFSQVVANLELTNKNLPLLNTTTGTPADVAIIDNMLSQFALGSGAHGTYLQCDFIGAMSNEYNDYLDRVTNLIKTLNTSQLATIYSQINSLQLPVADPDTGIVNDNGEDATLNALITQANSVISAIYSANTVTCEQINYFWSKMGEHMYIEQRALALAIEDPDTLAMNYSRNDIPLFVKQIEQYALENSTCGPAKMLEAISDASFSSQGGGNQGSIGGQSLIAALREARNAQTLSLAGIPMMNDVPTKSTSPYIGVDTCSASATATVTGGRISSVKVTSSSTGYTQANLPNILVLPIGHGASLKPILATDGSIKEITIENGGEGFIPGTVSIIIDSPPRCQPQPSPTSRLGTPYSQLVPPGLLTDSSASPDVATAIEDVTQCNCDCWTV